MRRDAAGSARPAAKGVEFSDHLIVLGAPSVPKAPVFVHRGAVAQAEMAADPCADHPAKPRSLSEHFEHTPVPEETPLQAPAHPYSPALTPPTDTPFPHPAAPDDDEHVETSCTDSDASAQDGPMLGPPPVRVPARYVPAPESDDLFQQCTRINTKLNSMPSGGTFSFMNSSEDVASDPDTDHTSDSSSSTSTSSTEDHERRRSSRRMIRVDGSAKLSSASGLADDDLPADDDEFGIEGAEKVDEEEAIQVRSFGRSFARVSLKDGEDVIIPDPRKRDKPRSEVAFAVPENDTKRSSSGRDPDRPAEPEGASTPDGSDDAVLQDFGPSRSDPPRRKSRIRIAFAKRSSTAKSVKNAERKSVDRKSVEDSSFERKSMDDALANRRMEPEVEVSSNSDLESTTAISCFPTRKATLMRQRTKSATPDAGPNGAEQGSPGQKPKMGWRGRKTMKDVGQLVTIPDMNEAVKGGKRSPSPERKIVKNVSLQHDDWIDFATNAARGQRHPWLVRVLSSNKASSSPPKPSKPVAAQTDPSFSSRRKSKRFWGLFGRKGR